MNPTIFVDSDAFIALAKDKDTTHEKAKRLLLKLLNEYATFYTSNYVFSETVTVLSQKVNHDTAVSYIKELKSENNIFLIKQVDEEIEDSGIEIFKKQTSKNTSFVDCTNMAFLQQLSCDAIFSFDEVYRKNGFLLVEDLVANMSQKD